MSTTKQAAEIISSVVQYSLDQFRKKGTVDLNERIVVHLIGKPGVGKTSIWKDVAAGKGIDYTATNVADRDPADLAGLPWERDGQMVRLQPDFVPEKGRINPTTREAFGEEGILLFDELAQGSAASQNAVRPATTEHRIGEHKLPGGWVVGACSNDQASRANTTRIGSHLSSSTLSVEVEPDPQEFLAWGASHNIHPHVLGYIGWSPNSLLVFDPDAKAFPSPRSWERASTLAKALENASFGAKLTALTGALGEAEAHRFTSYVKLANDLVTPSEVWADPMGVDMPERRDVLYALISALSFEVTQKTSKAYLSFLERVPQDSRELVAFGALTALERDKKLRSAPGFAAWLAANSWLLLP